jgi:hypothetical protein
MLKGTFGCMREELGGGGEKITIRIFICLIEHHPCGQTKVEDSSRALKI